MSTVADTTTPGGLTPDREQPTRGHLLGALYGALDTFQRTNRLPGLQHAQMRAHLAEHLRDTLLADNGPVAALLAERDRHEAEAHQYRTALQGAARKADSDRTEQDGLREELRFLRENTLPELHRTAEHHEAGKKRWLDQAADALDGLDGTEVPDDEPALAVARAVLGEGDPT